MGERTVAEHLEWSKERALRYVESGDLMSAWASMMSDLGKHDGTANHPAVELGMMLVLSQKLDTKAEMKKFIEGFK